MVDISLFSTLKLSIAIIMIAFALLIAIAILKAAYNIWMNEADKPKGTHTDYYKKDDSNREDK